MSSREPSVGFKKWRVLLWPLGGALLGLIVMPLTIEQYPEFFRENTWLLPLSTIVTAACFIVPVLFHERAIRVARYVSQVPNEAVGLLAAALLPLAAGGPANALTNLGAPF